MVKKKKLKAKNGCLQQGFVVSGRQANGRLKNDNKKQKKKNFEKFPKAFLHQYKKCKMFIF